MTERDKLCKIMGLIWDLNRNGEYGDEVSIKYTFIHVWVYKDGTLKSVIDCNNFSDLDKVIKELEECLD